MTITVVLESKDSNIVDSRTVEQTTIAETTNLWVLGSTICNFMVCYGLTVQIQIMVWI